MKASAFTRYWLPGLLLQSVVVGGGYATGRELVEFFLGAGPVHGLLGMLVSTVLFSAAAVLSFELARLSASFNYRSFFGVLLGRGWFLYEIAYFVLGLLVLAVVAAAAGEIVAANLGWPRVAGTVLLIGAIALLVFRGSALIEKVLAGWSFVLYATYAVLLACYLWFFGDTVPAAFAAEPPAVNWFGNGVRYFGYNAAIIPLILFCVAHLDTRRDAVTAGLLAGPLVMLPAAMFFVAMSASYPEILAEAVPADFMLQRLDFGWLAALFYVVVFGTFVETGAAFVHALNERVALRFEARQRRMPQWFRPAIATGALVAAVVLAASFGLVELIARGYGTLTWLIILVFIVPLGTVGIVKIRRLAAASG
ncbi:MAG TPA: hypothetical protein VFY03_03015 [Woeseiaceae bacterium]|nr:hypothetical protein [Woeseiaceae bacterium]